MFRFPRLSPLPSILLVATLVSGCGAFTGADMASKDAEVTPAADGVKELVFFANADLPRDIYAERLIGYALRCWVRNDPNYRLSGPAEIRGSYEIGMINVSSPDPELDVRQVADRDLVRVEGLRLIVGPGPEGMHRVDAIGPLAQPQFAAHLAEGVRRAGAEVAGRDCA